MKPFTIYFPQFYPTPTNNNVWGEGFTDWTLVAYANLKNKWQRRAPARGFYDGSSIDIHLSQIDEMRNYGLGGLALYHYWFFSHQELNAVEKTILNRNIDFPWFLIWATESWSKRWVGETTPILELNNNPSYDLIKKHCLYLAQCFENENYLKINNKPVFIIYNPSHFSDPQKTVNMYRDILFKMGFDICLGHFIKNPFDINYSNIFDINYLFEPRLFFGFQRLARGNKSKKISDLIVNTFGEAMKNKLLIFLDSFQQTGKTYSSDKFLKYLSSNERLLFSKKITSNFQNVLSPGWNNTPRYADKFTCLESIDPQNFSKILKNSCLNCPSIPPLINAWNEWSEGAAVEPCAYFGNDYLKEIKECFNKSSYLP